MTDKFYSSVYRHKGQIFANWFDETGERHITKEKYEPYLFVDHPDGAFRTVYGRSVTRVDFDNVWDAAAFIKKRDTVHGTTNWEQQYIYHNFEPGVYDRDKLNIGFLDIETDVEGGYPDIETADKKITLIQLLVNGEMWVFGLKAFNTDDLWKDGVLTDATKKVHYLEFESESLMLRKFIRVWEMLYLDAVTGWNTRFFDLPYIIRRLIRVLGESFAERLSPYGIAPNPRRAVMYGRDIEIFEIPGVADIDYIELYRKFLVPLRGQPESFALDYIAQEELGVKKIDYSEYGDLGKLYKENPQKYAEYGCRDAELVYRLDDKLNLIEIALVLAYDAGVNIQDVFGTVKPWDAIIHRYLMDKNIVVPNVDVQETSLRIEGGHVKDPQVGLHRWVVSFDLTSLYPHVIIQNNMGAETKIKRPKAPVRSNDFLQPDFNKRQYCDDTTVLAGNGAMFSNQTQSFLSALMEETFNKRKVYKKQMLEAAQNKQDATTDDEKEKWERVRVRFDNLQHATKIKLNSAYGALANRYNRWYDPDIAEGITQSGQVAIKWAERAVNNKLNADLGTTDYDYVIAIDTDSLYISLERLVDRVFPGSHQADTKKIIEFMDRVCEHQIQPTISKAYDDLAKLTDAFAQKMDMKREALANKGIWTGKKHYILNVYNNEGVSYDPPKRKMVGIEAVKSSTPGAARKYIEEAIGIILEKEEGDLQQFLKDVRAKYNELPLDEIAFPRGCNGIEKWSDTTGMYKKGCPIHVSSAINFNTAIKQKNLTAFPDIKSGDKIKFVYLNPRNPWRFKSIAFMSILPPELGLEPLVDRRKQYEKGFLKAVQSITDVIGWQTEEKQSIGGFFVEQ